MGAGSTAKRRRTGTDSSANSITPSRVKSTSGTGRGRGRPPNVPRDGRERPPPLAECFRKRCSDVLDRLSKKDHYNIFLEPVNTDDVVGYAETIKRPMDFTTMRTKLSRQVYKSLGEFRKDLDLIWSNCLLFNGKEPTNIFSKKAIELRRLTEKLIVTTRQYLEKDKENLLKWKEKHRRRKETMQANAANANLALRGSSIGVPPSQATRDPRPQPGTGGRDPMDTVANDFPREEPNGRTPEENALAESMRLQYAGATGLYRKGMLYAPLPQYTNPDGSVVQIPIRRYRPGEDHWNDEGSLGVRPVRHISAPGLYCGSLPVLRKGNPCQPRPNVDSMLVKDYAASLYDFVKEMGPIASEIVTELLSPELAIKKQQEDFLRQGLTLKDLAEKAKASSLQKQQIAEDLPENRWDANAISKLADDIERANRRMVSMLPQLSRPINELDGISGLAQFLDPSLVREVDEVPVQVVDYAMPHGVSLSTMAEICRLQNAPAVQMSQRDLQSIDALRKRAQVYLSRIGPESAAKMSGASILTPAQLHEIQLRARAIRQHRRMEAERQARIIEERRRLATGREPENLLAMHKRELEMSVQSNERTGAGNIRAAASVPYQSIPQQGMDVVANANQRAQAAMDAVRERSIALSQQAKGSRTLANIPPPPPPPPQVDPVINALPPADKNSVCKNCGTRDTLGWRAGGVGPDGVERLCIPCGLYWQKTNRHRPKELWGQPSQRKLRAPLMTATANGLTQRGVSPSTTPNGIAKRPIQKTQKTPQPLSRRSPPSGGSRAKGVKPRVVPAGPFSQGSRPIHAAQPITSVPNIFTGPNLESVPPQVHNAAQLFTNQRNDLEARHAIAAQNLQSLQGVHRSNSATAFTNAVSSDANTSTNVQHHLHAGVNPLMYRDPATNPAPMSSQQLMVMASQGQPGNLVAMQKHQLMQQKAIQQQLGAQGGISNAMISYDTKVQQANSAQMMLNVNGNMPQRMVPNAAQLNMLQHVGLQKEVQNVNNGELRGNQVGVSDAIAMGGGLGGAVLPSFANQGNVGSAMVGSFGDGVARGTFGSSPAVNGEGVASDQIVEDIFFADGAIEAPTGSPEFDF